MHQRTRNAIVGSLVGVLLGAAVLAMGGSTGAGSTSATGDANPAAGIWERVSGTLPLYEDALELTYLSIDPDGSFSAYGRDATTNVLEQADGVQGPAGTSTLAFQAQQGRGAQLLRVTPEPAGADTLGLTDVYGNTATFARRGSVPPALEPLTFTTVVQRRTDLGQVPDSATGLVWDGSSLWFTATDDLPYPIDPATGLLGAPGSFGATQFEMVHAFQGGNFWNHCRCGGNEEAKRMVLGGGEVDTVDTEDFFAEGINIGGIAWDPVDGALWIHGRDRATDQDRLSRVDSDVEPDVLLDSAVFDVDIEGLTWDGSHLWAVTRTSLIIRIDVNTFQATATYRSPDSRVRWTGIAFAPSSSGGGGSLYLVGENSATNQGELIELRP